MAVDSSGVHLWLVLWKAYEAVSAFAERSIGCLGLGHSGFRILEALLHKGPLNVNALCPVAQLTPGSVSVAIDRLEEKGWVERRNDPGDRRARIVHLTAEGERLIGEAFAKHAAALETATSGLTPEEKSEAVRLLKKLGLRAEEVLRSCPGKHEAG